MASLARTSAAVQRLLGIGGAWRGGAPLGDLAQRLTFSTDSGSNENETEPPKKRRGRPPKAKSADEEAAPAAAPAATPAAPAPPPPPPPAPKRVRAPVPPRLAQGLATVGSPLAVPAEWHSGRSTADLLPGAASPAPVGAFVDVPDGALPEGDAAFYHDPALAEDRVRQVHYGCKGASTEFAFLNGRRALLHRPAIAELLHTVLGDGPAPARVLVEGWTGAGKSMALYALAAAAREAGRVVMYIPSATLLVQGGRFLRCEEAEAAGGAAVWDTPEAARHLLNGLLKAHGESGVLSDMETPDGRPLAAVAAEGAGAAAPRVAVEAAIAVKDGLLADSRGLVIVDDYNALYGRTGYVEPMHAHHNRPIPADELRLAAAFRVLTQGAGAGTAVVAPTYSAGISSALRLPRAPGGATLRVPRFSLSEVAAVAGSAVAVRALPHAPGADTLRRALALSNGNARELRALTQTLLAEESPLGVSLGYKALAAAKRAYNLALE